MRDGLGQLVRSQQGRRTSPCCDDELLNAGALRSGEDFEWAAKRLSTWLGPGDHGWVLYRLDVLGSDEAFSDPEALEPEALIFLRLDRIKDEALIEISGR